MKSTTRSGTILVLLLVASIVAERSGATPAENRDKVSEQQFKEYQVKAAFLYNFTKFVEWRGMPLSKTEDSLVICVAGQAGAVRAVVETLTAKKGLTVRTLKAGDDPSGCGVLFQSAAERPLRDNWSELTKSGALVVTEDPAQLNRGSILNFYLADGKVRFEANLAGAKASGFRLSSQLLQLARIAKPDGRRE